MKSKKIEESQADKKLKSEFKAECSTEPLIPSDGLPTHPAIETARADIFRKQVFGEELNYEKYVKLIPTEMMIAELRSRELSKPLNAIINVGRDGTVGFEIQSLNWPVGKYEVKITFEKEIHP